MIIENKLDQFYKSTLESATSKKIALLEEFEQSLEKNLQSHKEATLRKADLSYKIEEKRLIKRKNSGLSNASLQVKRILSEKSGEIVNKVFEKVISKLKEYMKTPEYTHLLINQIIKAKEYAGDTNITIYINPTDEALKTELEAATGVSLTISKIDFLGGIRAVIPSRNILIDNSFVNKLKDAKEAFQL